MQLIFSYEIWYIDYDPNRKWDHQFEKFPAKKWDYQYETDGVAYHEFIAVLYVTLLSVNG